MSIVKLIASWSVRLSGVFILVFFACVGCAQHYCPTYASTTYNQSFTYKAEKSMAYKPVKVHEFDKKKMVKSTKKEKTKSTVR